MVLRTFHFAMRLVTTLLFHEFTTRLVEEASLTLDFLFPTALALLVTTLRSR